MARGPERPRRRAASAFAICCALALAVFALAPPGMAYATWEMPTPTAPRCLLVAALHSAANTTAAWPTTPLMIVSQGFGVRVAVFASASSVVPDPPALQPAALRAAACVAASCAPALLDGADQPAAPRAAACVAAFCAPAPVDAAGPS